MRIVRLLSYVVFPALVVTVVFTINASATTLCEKNVGHANECPVGSRIPEGTNVVGLTNILKIRNPFTGAVLMECGSEILGKIGKNYGSHTKLVWIITNLRLYTCSAESVCASATAENFPYLAEILDLTLTEHVSKGEEAPGPPGLTIKECPLGVSCLYSLKEGKALLEVSEEFLIASSVPLTRGSCGFESFFPAEALLEAKYQLTLDQEGQHKTPVYVAALP